MQKPNVIQTDQKITEIGTKITDLYSKITTITSQNSGVSSQIASIISQINTMTSQIATISAQISNLNNNSNNNNTTTTTSTYYVDSMYGSDSNNGTSSSTPWKTISKVNSTTLNPGNIVSFKCGSIWREQLSIPSSGNSNTCISFTSYGSGDKPIISSLDVITSWSTENSLYYVNYDYLPSSVVYNGTLLQNTKTKSNVATGLWFYDSTNKRVYIGDNPSGNTVEISSTNRNNALNTNGQSYIVVDGLNLIGSGSGTQNYTVYCANNSSNVTIRNCYIHDSFGGISTQGSVGNSCLFESNHIYNIHANGFTLNASNANGWIVRGNEIDHCGILGEQVLQTSSGQDIYSQGMFGVMKDILIESNKIHHITNGSITDNQAVNHDVLSHGLYWGNTKMTIRYNLFYNCSNTAIKLNGSCNDSEIYYNICRNNGTNAQAGNGNGILVYGSQGIKVYNNIFANNLHRGVMLFDLNNVASTISDMKNNIFYSNVNGQVVVYGSSSITSSDYNCWYNGSNALSDTHGIASDPKFVSPSNYDFHLQSTSPCINTGASVGLTRDYDGTAVSTTTDIGALEYISSINNNTNNTNNTTNTNNNVNGSIAMAVNTVTNDYNGTSFSEKKISLAYKYDSSRDFLIDIVPGGASRLPNIGSYYTASNTSSTVSNDFSRSKTQLLNVATDYIMPYQVYALNNPTNSRVDGQRTWTGGYHGATGTNFNLPSSAKNTSYRVWIDGNERTADTGDTGIIATTAIVEIINNICAFNTIDITNGYISANSRAVLTEKHTLTLKSGGIEKITEIKALEDIKIFVHYGAGMMLSETNMDSNTTIQYINGVPSTVINAFGKDTSSGSKSSGAMCTMAQIKTSSGDVRELYVDTTYGIGNYANISTSASEMFMDSSFNKLYIDLIDKPDGYQYDDSSFVTMSAGQTLTYKVGWNFYKN